MVILGCFINDMRRWLMPTSVPAVPLEELGWLLGSKGTFLCLPRPWFPPPLFFIPFAQAILLPLSVKCSFVSCTLNFSIAQGHKLGAQLCQQSHPHCKPASNSKDTSRVRNPHHYLQVNQCQHNILLPP